MAKDRTIKLTIDVETKLNNFKNQIDNMAKEFNKLAGPTNIKANMSGQFKEIQAQYEDLLKYVRNNELSVTDRKKVDAEFRAIVAQYDSLLRKMQKDGGRFKIVDSKELTEGRKQISAFADQWGKVIERQKTLEQNQKNWNESLDSTNKSLENTVQQISEAEQKIKDLKKAQEDAQSTWIGNKKSGGSTRTDTQLAGDYRRTKEYQVNMQAIEAETAALKKLRDEQQKLKDEQDVLEASLEKVQTALTKNKQAYENSGEAFKKLKTQLKGITELDLSKVENFDDLANQLRELDASKLEKANTILKDLQSNLEADTKGLDSLKDEFDVNADKADDFAKTLDNFKNKAAYFLGLENAVRLFRRALSAAYDTVKDLDKVMTQTAVVTEFSVGDMWSQLPEYTKRANELGVAIHDAYEAATLYYQQGLSTNEVMAVSNETLKMARIAGLDAADATDRMTNALRGFNMEITEANAQNVNDVYSKLAAITASNTDEISTAMTKVASLAHNANMEFENTAAFLAQIIETTRESAETAGTALKTVVARFSEVKSLYSKGELMGKDDEGEDIDVNKVSKALRSAGIDLNEYFTGAKGLDEIFIELAKTWDSLDQVQQRYIATMAAGSRQQSRFIALMSDYKRTMELTTAAQTSAGASQQQFDKTLESLETKLNRLKNAWDSFAMSIANNEIIKAAVDALTGLLTTINNLTDKLPGALSGLSKLAVVFGGMKLGGNLIKSQPFQTFFKNIQQTMRGNAADNAKIFSDEFKDQLKTQFGGRDAFKNLGSNLKAYFTKGSSEAIDAAQAAYDKATAKLHNAEQGKKVNGEFFTGLHAEQSQRTAITKATNEQKAAYEALEKAQAEGVHQTEEQVQATQQIAGAFNTAGAACGAFGTGMMILGSILEESGMVSKETGQTIKTIGGILMGVGAILPMVGQAFTAMGDKAAEAGTKALASLGWIAAIIVAVSVLIGMTIALGKAAQEASNEGQMKKIDSRLESINEELGETTNKLNELNEAKDDLQSLTKDLDKYVQGTRQWKQALAEVNLKVLEIIDKYPTLSKYMNRENGQLSISEEGWDKVIEEQTKYHSLLQLEQKSLKLSRLGFEQSELVNKAQYNAANNVAGRDLLLLGGDYGVTTRSRTTQYQNEYGSFNSNSKIGLTVEKWMAQAADTQLGKYLLPFVSMFIGGANGGAISGFVTGAKAAWGGQNNMELFEKRQNGGLTNREFARLAAQSMMSQQATINQNDDLSSGINAVENLLKGIGKTEKEAASLATSVTQNIRNLGEDWYDFAEESYKIYQQQLEAGREFYNTLIATTPELAESDFSDALSNLAESFAEDFKDTQDDLYKQLVQGGTKQEDLFKEYAKLMPNLEYGGNGYFYDSEKHTSTQIPIETIASAVAAARMQQTETGILTAINNTFAANANADGLSELIAYLKDNGAEKTVDELNELNKTWDDLQTELLKNSGFKENSDEWNRLNKALTDMKGNLTNSINQIQTDLAELDNSDFWTKQTKDIVTKVAKNARALGKETGKKYVKGIKKLIEQGISKDNLAEILNTDPSNLMSVVTALQNIDRSAEGGQEAYEYLLKLTEQAAKYCTTLEEALGLQKALNGALDNVDEILKRFAEGTATTEDYKALRMAGYDTTGIEWTTEGYYLDPDSIEVAGDLLRQAIIDGAKITADETEEAYKTNVNKIESGNFEVTYDRKITNEVDNDDEALNEDDKTKLINLIKNNNTYSTDPKMNALLQSVRSYIGDQKTMGSIAYNLKQNGVNIKNWLEENERKIFGVKTDTTTESQTYTAISKNDKTGMYTAQKAANMEEAKAVAEALPDALDRADYKNDTDFINAVNDSLLKFVDGVNDGTIAMETATQTADRIAAKTQSAATLAMNGANDTTVKAAALREGEKLGYDRQEMMDFRQQLVDINNALKENDGLTALVALNNTKLNSGLGKIISSYKDWNELIDENGELKEINSSEDSKIYNELKRNLQEMLGGTELSDDFVADHIDLITQAASGTEEEVKTAITELQKFGAIEILTKIRTDDVGPEVDTLINWLQNNPLPELEAGVALDDGPFKDMLASLVTKAKETGVDVNDALKAIGMNFEWKEVKKTIKNPSHDFMMAVHGFANIPETITVTDYDFVSSGTGGGSITSKNFAGAASNGSSKKGSSSKPDVWKNPYDELYNLNQKINELIRERNKLEREHARMIKDEATTMDDIRKSYRDNITSMVDQMGVQQDKKALLQAKMANIGNELYYDKDGNAHTFKSMGAMNAFDKFDPMTGEFRINLDYLNSLENDPAKAEEGKAAEALIKLAEQWQGDLRDTEDAIDDLQDAIDDWTESAIETYLSFEQRVMDAYVNRIQKQIDTLKAVDESIAESTNAAIDAMQKAIDDDRQARENQKTEQEISDKEARLAYLQRDTSGANDLEIMQLQQELDDDRQAHTDDLINQQIEEIRNQAEEAATQRERQIELLQQQHEDAKKNGEYWDEVHTLMAGAVGEDGRIAEGSGLYNLLADNDGLKSMSVIAQENWAAKFEEGYKNAMTGLTAAEIKYPGVLDTMEQEVGGIATTLGQEIEKYKTDAETIKRQLADLKSRQPSTNNGGKNTSGSGVEAPVERGGTDGEPPVTPPTEVPVNKSDQEAFAALLKMGYYTNTTLANEIGSENAKAVGRSLDLDEFNEELLKYNGKLLEAWKIPKFAKYKIGATTWNKFASGGLANFTGPAWLDGTKSNPELVLSQRDTANFIELKNYLAELKQTQGSLQGSGGDNYFEIQIDADINDDYDVDQLAERIKYEIVQDANYRNVRALNYLH